jgi:MFS family permease
MWLEEVPMETDSRAGAAPASVRALDIVSRRYFAGTLLLWLLFIFMLTISYCLNSWLPTLLVQVGHEQRFAALSVTIFSFGGIVAALVVGVLIDRFGAVRTLVTFLGISTVLLYVIGDVLATASTTTLTALLAACGFFVLGAYGGVNVVLATYYPSALRATGIGWAKSIGRFGTLIAPVLIGAALTASMAETTILSLFAIPALLAAMSLILISRQNRQFTSARA